VDLRIVLATFGAVFLAELGDKTQVATLCLATGKSPWSVFTGSAAALVLASLLAVVVGCVLQKQGLIPTVWIKRGAALCFLIMGVLMLLSTFGAGGNGSAAC
jgi:putative Ca2+/H+ antiporter (TMEM165/GDT1 family)